MTRKLIPLFALSLCLLFGCGSQHSWIIQRGQSNHTNYASSKLIFPTKIPTDEMELEFMHTQNRVELFLIVHGRPIGENHQHPKEIPLKVESSSKTFTTIVYRHDGGQKFTVATETQSFIVECLKKEQPVTLTLPGYSKMIDPKGFANYYDRFIHTLYLENPFVLPF